MRARRSTSCSSAPFTWTANVAVPALPAWSVAVQVTVASPTAKTEPDAGAHAGATSPLTRSVAVTAYAMLAPLGATASTTIGGGMLPTVILNPSAALLPDASYAVA